MLLEDRLLWSNEIGKCSTHGHASPWRSLVPTGLPGFLVRHLGFPDTAFSQIEGLWPRRVKQVYPCHFSNSICSLPVSV